MRAGARRTVVAQFGDREVIEGILEWASLPVTDPNRRGFLTLTKDTLLSHPVDFAAPCRVLVEADNGSRVTDFTGVVYSAEMSGAIWRIELRTGSQQLTEQRMAGTVIGSETPVLELMWSLLRIAGVPEDRIDIQGLALPLRSSFEVVSPVAGLSLDAAQVVGNVTFTSDPVIGRSVDDLRTEGSMSLISRFKDAEAWAWVTVPASTLDEAERIGLEAIELGIDYLLLAARYSLSLTPDGKPLHYFRPVNRLAMVRRGDVVHVRSVESAHRWVRGVNWTLDRPRLNVSAVQGVDVARAPSESNVLSRAVSAWRRAADAQRPFDQVSALWQALELYASGVSSLPLFSQAELRSIRVKLAAAGLTVEQQQRIREMTALLNNPPLMVRLTNATRSDGVSLSSEEFAVLRRVRALRNDVEHGNVPTPPQTDDVHQAIAIAARLICHAVMIRAANDGSRR